MLFCQPAGKVERAAHPSTLLPTMDNKGPTGSAIPVVGPLEIDDRALHLPGRSRTTVNVPMFQPVVRGGPVAVYGRMRLPDTSGFGCRAQSRRAVGAPNRQLTSQLSRAAAARSAARLTSSVWMPGTAAMAPFDSRVSGAPA
jgi:hypothetical protein